MKRRKETRGRKPEGRVKMLIHVLPATSAAIRAAVDKKRNTLGRVIDSIILTGKPPAETQRR